MPSAATSTKTTTNKATPAGAPHAVAYPTRAGAVSGLPISAGGVLALVAAIALFVLAALGLRRLSVGSEDAPRRPQVSSS
jgi:flagellar biogenesis protein FliO